MKIAITSVQEFNPQIGGIERVSVSLATELIRNSIEVIFISRRKSIYSKSYELPAKQYFLSEDKDYSESCISEIIHIINKEKVDILLNQNSHSYLFNKECEQVKMRTGVKLISAFHFCPDMRIRANRNLVDFFFFTFKENLVHIIKDICTRFPFHFITLYSHRKLYKHLYKISDAVVLLSNKFNSSFCNIAGINNSNRITAINNMLSFQSSSKIEHKKKKKQILFCARLSPQKAPYRALYVWKKIYTKLPDWELVILGSGPFFDRLLISCQRLNLPRVRFEGFKNPIKYYQRASIFLMTSNYEGWGLSITEAMQYGCVPMAFRSYDSIDDIIDNGVNGFIIEPFDINEMANKVLEVANSSCIESISNAAYNKSLNFKPTEISHQWIKLFNHIVS